MLIMIPLIMGQKNTHIDIGKFCTSLGGTWEDILAFAEGLNGLPFRSYKGACGSV